MALSLIPTAFRIKHFRSISDSGECTLSGDQITVLAGQNEAGKTAVLTALRDFDLDEGKPPLTPEYRPDGKYEVEPAVAVMFRVEVDELIKLLDKEDQILPEAFITYLRSNTNIWVTRSLDSGKFSLDGQLQQYWPAEIVTQLTEEDETEEESSSDEDEDGATEDEDDADEDNVDDTPATPPAPTLIKFSAAGGVLRKTWPLFVYFDSFKDILPRDVVFDNIVTEKNGTMMFRDEVPSSVRDFVGLSKLDLQRVKTFASQSKSLNNYLEGRSADITGDFLTYWKQKTEGKTAIDLHVKAQRDEQGKLRLAFYVRDENVEQYPEQRSQGFLWFLSFYLRLASAEQDTASHDQLLLIDEPGTYLHARAQRDVLHLFEDRVAKRQQIVYSTHSPFLLPPNKLHRIRVVLKTASSETKVLDRLTHPDLQGQEFTDTLTPIIAAIGLDVREMLSVTKPKNLLVEGISDQMYLSAWKSLYTLSPLEDVNIFPGTGALSLLTFTSLFVGWGLKFAVLLDRDKKGDEVKSKLRSSYNISNESIVQPKNAAGIEDLLSTEDFRNLLQKLDTKYSINSGESPSAAIRRQNIDKVLLARTYSEETNKGTVSLTKKTTDAVDQLLQNIASALQD